jgi:mannose-6-phosphate isomerase-like protein (cupin superfamily)
MAAGKGVRRVVTRVDEAGTAVIGFDSTLPVSGGEPQLGVEGYLLWITDETPADISKTGDTLRKIGIPPPANGSIFRVVDFHPTPDPATLDPEFLAKLVGHHTGGKAPRHPAMHRTRSIDYAIVMSGEIDMLVDEGEVHLKAGDVLVQQGTNHAWINRGKDVCSVAFVLIDAKEPK